VLRLRLRTRASALPVLSRPFNFERFGLRALQASRSRYCAPLSRDEKTTWRANPIAVTISIRAGAIQMEPHLRRATARHSYLRSAHSHQGLVHRTSHQTALQLTECARHSLQ